jgi:hypothetical protein
MVFYRNGSGAYRFSLERRRCGPSLTQSRHDDFDAKGSRGFTVVDALQRRDVAVLATDGHENVLASDSSA